MKNDPHPSSASTKVCIDCKKRPASTQTASIGSRGASAATICVAWTSRAWKSPEGCPYCGRLDTVSAGDGFIRCAGCDHVMHGATHRFACAADALNPEKNPSGHQRVGSGRCTWCKDESGWDRSCPEAVLQRHGTGPVAWGRRSKYTP